MYSTNLDILNYTDYRKFLKDVVDEQKILGQFSYRKFSKLAGFGSPNFLLLIIQNERNISEETTQTLGQVFHIRGLRLQYFSELVLFNQSTNPEERFHISQNILKLKSRLNVYKTENELSDYFKNWLNSALRELLIIDPEIKINEIPKRLITNVKTSEIKRSIKLLTDLKLISYNNSKWIVTVKSISTGDEFVTASAFKYHKDMIELAKNSLNQIDRSKRSITATTISLSWKNFKLITEKINSLREEILALSDIDEQKEEVFQLNFQCFPLSLKKTTEPLTKDDHNFGDIKS